MPRNLPDTIILDIKGKKQVLHRVKKNGALSGLSEKSMYQDEEGQIYFVKMQKSRTHEQIFKAQVSPALYKIKDLLAKGKKLSETDQIILEKHNQHMQELRDNASFLEVLGPRIAKHIFGDLLVVPENYFYVDVPENEVGRGDRKVSRDSLSPPDLSISEPSTPDLTTESEAITLVLSKGLPNFQEFLSDLSIVKGKTKPLDWDLDNLPTRANLNLTPEQAKILGVLLAVALLTGHLDILNNINLSNSGSIKLDKNRSVAAIVDWGNSFGVGFGGLSAEESSFENIDIILRKGLINFNNKAITDFQHCVPFDEIIYPLLPRQLVKDLFNMTDKDSISQAMLEGFNEACEQASKSIKGLEEMLQVAIQETKEVYTKLEDQPYIQKFLNHEFYKLADSTLGANGTENGVAGKKSYPRQDSYNLLNVLKGRIHSLLEIREKLNKGMPLEKIATDCLRGIIEAQRNPKKMPPTVTFYDSKSDFDPPKEPPKLTRTPSSTNNKPTMS